jgi:predicted PurR-regulated permease PerM
LVRQQIASFQSFSAVTLAQTVSLATSVLTLLFYALLTLIFSFYFVIDGDRLWKTLLAHTPTQYHDGLAYTKRVISQTFAGFLRTQVLLAILMGAITYLILIIFGVPYATTAATFTGLGMMIPVLGPVLAVVPPVVVALVTEPQNALIIFVLVFAIQAIIVNVAAPIAFKRTVGLHPVLVLVSFIVGFRVLGWWGAVFAVPVAAVIIIIGSQLLQHSLGPRRI